MKKRNFIYGRTLKWLLCKYVCARKHSNTLKNTQSHTRTQPHSQYKEYCDRIIFIEYYLHSNTHTQSRKRSFDIWQRDFFRVTFDHFWNDWYLLRLLGRSANLLRPKMKPLRPNSHETFWIGTQYCNKK